MNKKSSLKVLQWNVWYLEKYEMILDELIKHPADIYCLQEVTIGFKNQNLINMPERLAADLKLNEVHSKMQINGGEYQLCNLILSRYPIVSSHITDINSSTGSNNFDDEHRTVLFAEIDGIDTTYTVATTHMSYTKAFNETDRKKAETMKLLEAIKPYNNNFILTGDLNALPNSYTVSALQKQLNNLGPNFSEKTWTTKPFHYDEFEAHTLDWRLDYVFGSKNVIGIRAEILHTLASDHLPILVEFSVN